MWSLDPFSSAYLPCPPQPLTQLQASTAAQSPPTRSHSNTFRQPAQQGSSSSIKTKPERAPLILFPVRPFSSVPLPTTTLQACDDACCVQYSHHAQSTDQHSSAFSIDDNADRSHTPFPRGRPKEPLKATPAECIPHLVPPHLMSHAGIFQR